VWAIVAYMGAAGTLGSRPNPANCAKLKPGAKNRTGGTEVPPGKAPTPMNLHPLLESAKACLAADVKAV